MIAPIEWLQAALSLLMVSDIIENTTSANDGQTWTYELSFYMRSAQLSTVRNCLVALQHICYQVPDFSHFKIEALRAGDVPVPQVSEYWASYNQMDVVKSTSLIPESWLFIVLLL